MKLYIKRGLLGLGFGLLLEFLIFNFPFVKSGFDVQQLHFSLSRVIAVVLILLVGTFLFRLQRMPDYHIGDITDDQETKKQI